MGLFKKAKDKAKKKAEDITVKIEDAAGEAVEKLEELAEKAGEKLEAAAEKIEEKINPAAAEEENAAEEAPAEEPEIKAIPEEIPAEEASAEAECTCENKEENAMDMLKVIDHPLVQHKLTIMRDVNTGAKDFRQLLDEISMLVGYEVTRDLPLCDVEIETPIQKMTGKAIAGKKLAIVPILRAGLGMVDGLLRLVPAAKVGHIGLYRDPETHEPVEYYCKLPEDIDKRLVVVTDPMLATGGSAADAVRMLKEKGCTDIRLMCLVAAPEGVKAFYEAHPDVPVFTAALDECLNDHAYIVPGLGDAGDRLFGTY